MKVTNEQFAVILRDAVEGDEKALETILAIYQPLINRHSMIDGKLDEDLRQLILIRIAFNIRRFKL